MVIFTIFNLPAVPRAGYRYLWNINTHLHFSPGKRCTRFLAENSYAFMYASASVELFINIPAVIERLCSNRLIIVPSGNYTFFLSLSRDKNVSNKNIFRLADQSFLGKYFCSSFQLYSKFIPVIIINTGEKISINTPDWDLSRIFPTNSYARSVFFILLQFFRGTEILYRLRYFTASAVATSTLFSKAIL